MKKFVQVTGCVLSFLAVFIANLGSGMLCGEEKLPESLK